MNLPMNAELREERNMSSGAKQELLIIDESLFYQLLGGAGTVHIDISCIEDHFVPFVSFSVDDEGGRVPYGAIMRNHQNLLAADNLDDLIDVLHDMAGASTSLQINYPDES
ncbi:MAG: hypothetical protein ACXWJK_10965, partial [Burkholderiaceae bacterium]